MPDLVLCMYIERIERDARSPAGPERIGEESAVLE